MGHVNNQPNQRSRSVLWRGALLALCVVVPLWLQGCGGGGGNEAPAAVNGVATMGAAGGTVRGEDGAQVIFPANALLSGVTVRIAKDSTGAPPLPQSVEAVGAAYTITPHGDGFSAHAEVSIPVQRTTLSDNEQLLLFTARPGDTKWTVLSGATYANGMLRASVLHFSMFMPVVIRNLQVPTLVTSVENMNNFGEGGARLMSPDYIFGDWGTKYGKYESGFHEDDDGKIFLHYVARLRYPAQRVSTTSLPASAVNTCLPISMGNSGAAFFFYRGNETFSPTVEHGTLRGEQSDAAVYPRTEAGFDETAMRNSRSPWPEAGFGAVHFYGQDSPRRGDLTPEVVALPPVNNVTDDDLYTWRGDVFWNAAQHNGRHRVDVWVDTICGFAIEAAPLSYQLNMWDGSDRYQGVNSSNSPQVATGSVATMAFSGSFLTGSVIWEYSTDSTNWQSRPLPPEVRVAEVDSGRRYREWQLVIDRAVPAHTGFYRARACSQSIDGDPIICLLGSPSALTVVSVAPSFTQHPAGLVVQRGETASFTAAPAGAPPPSLQWQRRSLQVAASGNHAWNDIAGATGTTLTLAATTMDDSATQVRLVASNGVGLTASDAAMLTVLERFNPPSVQSQPGSLNVVVGGTAVFASSVEGSAPLNYQWKRNGVAITGANGTSLTLTNVSAADSARYELVVSNRAGSVTTEPATLVVTLGVPVPLAPTIAAPPTSVSLTEGQTAQFAVSVNGTGPYTYQWLKNGTPIVGAESASFLIAATNMTNQGAYSVRVTNSVGTVVSASALLSVNQAVVTVTPPVVVTLVVPLAPTIAAPPASVSLTVGQTAQLAVSVSGTGPYTYQWLKDGTPIAGAEGANFVIAAANVTNQGAYSVRVTNSVGVAVSAAATLSVVPVAVTQTPPVIVTGPAGLAVVPQGGATFAVAFTGTGPFTFQWFRDGQAIAGATGAVLHLAAVTSLDAGQYSVEMRNAAGIAASSSAQLIVIGAPAITTQPTAIIANEGATATFSVQAVGAGLRYQWTRNQVAIGGATSATYTTPALALSDSGAVYAVVVYNGAGVAISQGAVLTVIAAPVNIGGTVNGLTGAGLALRNNSIDQLAVNADGAFTFAQSVAAGSPYDVVVLSQPTGQTCSVQNASGTASANVTNISVSCSNVVGAALAISPAPATALGCSRDTVTFTASGGAAPYSWKTSEDFFQTWWTYPPANLYGPGSLTNLTSTTVDWKDSHDDFCGVGNSGPVTITVKDALGATMSTTMQVSGL